MFDRAVTVSGEGPRPCRLMLIGEFPGIEEGRRGRPFVGKSGRELRRYLNGYQLPLAEDVYLTNYSKTVATDANASTFTEADAAALRDELAAVRPAILVTLGARVTAHFLGDPDLHLEACHGIAHTIRLPHGRVTLFPAYNPAAMLHSPKLQATFASDMARLRLLLRGQLPPHVQDERPGVYRLVDDGAFEIGQAEIAVDTEGWTWLPWGASWSATPYTGFVARHGSAGLAKFFRSVEAYRPRLILHNALHDLDVLRALGLDLDAAGIPFDDTMVMAYLLGIEPQGLKPLAYRHAGMRQREYADLTADAAAAIALTWLVDLLDRLPDKAVTLTKRDAVAQGLWPAKCAEKYVPIRWPPLDDREQELAQAKTLIERMLAKGDGATLRKRWADGRAREILVEEQAFLPPGQYDPPDATLDDVPLIEAVEYAGRDPDATLRIKPVLQQQITAYGLDDVYQTDLAVLPVFGRMQQIGLKADPYHFVALGGMLAAEEVINHDLIADLVGHRVNPNSGDQVAALLFDELRLDREVTNVRLKKTKTGDRYSTNDKTLEAIRLLHPVIPLIQDGREIRKIKGTYCDPLPFLLGADGRLHPNYRITRTETGRPSAADPNVLAFPKHSTRGKLVRDGFIVDEGHEMGEWDLAQIEMCVFAHDSNDAAMIAEICSGVDKHAATAGKMFGRDPHVILAEKAAHTGQGEQQRFAAKAVNFGILMGITAFGLLDQFHKNGMLDWDLDQCERLLQEWFKAYPDAAAYIESKHAEARRYGCVRDMWGRLRWLEGIHSDDDYIRAEAERQAQATPTQSGAQGIIKRVMRAVWPTLKALRQDFWVEPLLQIHDALILEYDARQRALVDAVMMGAMTSTVQLRVPIKASASYGLRWGAL